VSAREMGPQNEIEAAQREAREKVWYGRHVVLEDELDT
jgi:hypothetical protein